MLKRSVLMCILLATSSCGKDKVDPAAGLPVASSWKGSQTNGVADPHAGLDMGSAADPHAGLDMGGAADPHAGLDMGGAADPHAGLDMDSAGAMGNAAGLQAPDPNRAIDPNMFLKGRIVASEATASLIRPGAILFISVRPINKATGERLGGPLAVERIDVQSLPVEFHLSAAQSMVAGTEFSGDVEIYARVDGDGEASSTLPGDVDGAVSATIPAKGLELVLGNIVK